MEISMPGPNASKTDLDDLFRTLAAIRTLSDPIDLGELIIIPATEISLASIAGSGRTVEDGREDEGRKGCRAGGIAAISPLSVVSVSRTCSGREGIRVLAISQADELVSSALKRAVERAMGCKTGNG
jgi:uncharacterized spore protein YtfJ